MPSPQNSRFYFLDALRGLAAISVVLHHVFFATAMGTVYESASPSWVNALLQTGANGVEVFFVLSGFVIAHSLRSNALSLQSLGRFILRRQVRLDPPYWMAIVLGLVALWARNRVPDVVQTPIPSIGELGLNALYLQKASHLPDHALVVGVAWTLCLEIQFYLLFITLLWVCHNAPRIKHIVRGIPVITNRVAAIMWLSGIGCLALRHLVVDGDAIYFWSGWHYFAAGVLAYWAAMRKISGVWIGSLLGAFALSWMTSWLSAPLHGGEFTHSAAPMALFVGAGTAVTLWQLGRRHKLGIWQNVRPLQYLGRISYSLYLTHLMVALMVLRFAYKITKENVPAAFGWMAFSVVLCLLVAHFFYLLVERPSLGWANALSKREPVASRHASADQRARALSFISSSSSSGNESATIPPPA